jgi:spermidine synthase
MVICLFLSGAGSLVLETVWSRRLELVFGATTLAISTVLAAYMLGLGIGGLIGGRLAARLTNCTKGYAVLEFGIAGLALFVPLLLSLLPATQRTIAELPFVGAVLLRFVLALLVLLLPTILMGATLPILVQAARRIAPGTRDPSALLYGVNTLGAVAGVMFVTFFTLPRWGLSASNWIGAILDLAAGGLALAILVPQERPSSESTPKPLARLHSLALSYGLVGFISLSCEVAWTRTLTLSFGSSIYAFAAILASFLAGIGLGSLIERRVIPERWNMQEVYGFGVLLLPIGSLGTFLILQRVPDLALWSFERWGTSAGSLMGATFGWSLAGMLVPTLILGAIFPILVRALMQAGVAESSAVGMLYFTNTIGSATGAFATGFLLIPQLGLAQTLTWLAALGTAAAAWHLMRTRRVWASAAAVLTLVLLVMPTGWNQKAMTRGVFFRPHKYMEFGLRPVELDGEPASEVLYYADGTTATISVHRDGFGIDLRANGKPDASYGDMPTQAMIAHVPMALAKPQAKLAVIGLASGVTVGTALLYDPALVEVIEIEPAMVGASRHFEDINYKPLESPKVKLLIEDGRHHLAYADQKFDVIISEPSNPVVAGCANLFTREAFRAAHEALEPGGYLMQWLQLYGMTDETVASVLAALSSEFRYVYGFIYSRGWNDLMLLASDRELTSDDLRRLDQVPEPARRDLHRLNVQFWGDFAAQLRLTPEDLKTWAKRAPKVNTDETMFVELESPWMIRRATEDVTARVDEAQGAVWTLPAGPGQRGLSADELAELAWSNLGLRADLRQAKRLLNAALDGGASPRSSAVAGLVLIMENRDGARGIANLEAAVQRAPNDWIVRSAAARALLAKGAHEPALQECQAALQLRPGDAREVRLRQQLFNKLGRLQEALADAEFGVASPYSRFEKTIWGEAGMLASRVGNHELAVKRLEHFLLREPQAEQVWKQLAVSYLALGRGADAARAERNAVTAARNQLVLVHRRARRTARFESVEEAKNLLRELIKVHPEYTAASEDLQRLERGETL